MADVHDVHKDLRVRVIRNSPLVQPTWREVLLMAVIFGSVLFLGLVS